MSEDSEGLGKLVFREDVNAADAEAVRDMVVSTGFFNDEEVEFAVELVEANLAQGAKKSGYCFLFADLEGQPAGYVCHGPIAGTQESFDLFWIVVHERCRGKGLGKLLMARSEEIIRRMGGHRIYVETSSRQQYVPTREFYLKMGYRIEAVIQDFYAPGDGKVIMVKVV